MMATASVKRVIVATTQNQVRQVVTSGAFQALFATICLFANLGMAMAAHLKHSVSTAAVRSIKQRRLSSSFRSQVCALVRHYPS